MKTKASKSLWAGIALTASIVSCTDTETVYPAPLPQNRMLEYKVVNLTDDVIYGAIDNHENTITVYIPYYLEMEVVVPEIRLDEGARLQEEILPVDVGDTTKTYTVKASDGSARTYKLIITPQYPQGVTMEWAAGPPLSWPYSSFSLTGNFQCSDNSTLNVSIINRTTGEAVPGDYSKPGILVDGNGYRMNVPVPATVDSGYYKVRVSFLGKTYDLDSLHIVYRKPGNPTIPSAYNVHAGDSISIPANPGFAFTGNLTSVSLKLFRQDPVDMEIVSCSRTEIVVKLPAGLIGVNQNAQVVLAFEEWGDITAHWGYFSVEE